MALTQWTQLSQDAKDIWDKLTDEVKGIILDRQRDSARPPGCGPPRPPFCNTNLHDLSSIILANIHDIHTESEGDVNDSPVADTTRISHRRVGRRLPLKTHPLVHCLPMPRNTRRCLRLTSVGSCHPR
jgi:hypothetical protein